LPLSYPRRLNFLQAPWTQRSPLHFGIYRSRNRTTETLTENPMPLETKGICPLLQVFNMPTSVRFYRDLLGFEIIGNSPPKAPDDFGWCWLKLHSTELMLNTAYDYDDRPPSPDPTRLKSHMDTCLYIGCPDVDAAYRFLVAQGLKPKEPNVTHYGMKQLHLKDPDGFGLCFQWRA
jgi:glyoxylase I family protein